MRLRILSLVAALSSLAIAGAAEARCPGSFGCDTSTFGPRGGVAQGHPRLPTTRIPSSDRGTYQHYETPRYAPAYQSLGDYIYGRGSSDIAGSYSYREAVPDCVYEECTFPKGQRWSVLNKDGTVTYMNMPPPIGEKPYRGARWACREEAAFHCRWTNPKSKSAGMQLRFYGDSGYYY